MSHAEEPQSPLSWWVASERVTFYRDGRPILTIPAKDYARLIADMAARLAERNPTVGG